jgi:hypothetical protein
MSSSDEASRRAAQQRRTQEQQRQRKARQDRERADKQMQELMAKKRAQRSALPEATDETDVKPPRRRWWSRSTD